MCPQNQSRICSCPATGKIAGIGPGCSALGFRAQPGCRSIGSLDLGPKQERLHHYVAQMFSWGFRLQLT
jgi:hypothetical protein